MIDDTPPDEELSPDALHDRWESATNLGADALRDFRDSELNAAYLDANSEQAQAGNEPLDDAIRLAETPADEWRDVDDGFNEVEEAREGLNFLRRTRAQVDSQGLGENYLTDREVMQKREAALVRWGYDPDDDREWL
jgi:hypothetical protein